MSAPRPDTKGTETEKNVRGEETAREEGGAESEKKKKKKKDTGLIASVHIRNRSHDKMRHTDASLFDLVQSSRSRTLPPPYMFVARHVCCAE